ncbi:MAG TPA: zinc-dependent peptidase [Candidatus Krumholzibacteria bacterium]|nr:zinc-dependent peptidase [Candidatus Krumholzibacteria bacterium]
MNPMHWWRDHRRQEILKTPFPPAWREILRARVAHVRRLDADETQRLEDLVQVFLAEKNFEGCGGLEITDEIRVVIAAQACLLVLELPHDLYRRLLSILVYPSTVVTPRAQAGVFVHGPLIERSRTAISGQASRGDTVILVWDAVVRGARHPEHGHNVVYHEFAHIIDMQDGAADGVPELPSAEQYRRWAEVCAAEFARLQAQARQGRASLLDPYGATNAAEFFAVATELFFDRPREMRAELGELYEVLAGFYRQDPAGRAS